MEQLASSCGVRILFKKGIPDHEMIDLLNRASCLIYTSHLEPFGLALLEAGACATPVVAIAEGGIRETLRDGVNGFLIPGNDSSAIGAAVLRLLQNPALVTQMGNQARQYVLENWNFEQAMDCLEKQLHEIA